MTDDVTADTIEDSFTDNGAPDTGFPDLHNNDVPGDATEDTSLDAADVNDDTGLDVPQDVSRRSVGHRTVFQRRLTRPGIEQVHIRDSARNHPATDGAGIDFVNYGSP